MLVPCEYDLTCLVAQCDHCGRVCEGESDPDRATAISMALACHWVLDTHDEWTCPGCAEWRGPAGLCYPDKPLTHGGDVDHVSTHETAVRDALGDGRARAEPQRASCP